ncbi:MAG: hypothetical protein WC848_02405 [Parcubacteria group bacterium]|jgi:hypothetical protein
MARNQKNTPKTTPKTEEAPKPEERPKATEAAVPTATEKVKSAWLTWEKVQNFAIIMAMLMGISKKPEPGSPNEGRVPDWVLSLIPEELTGEDETWRNLGLSSCSNRIILIVEEEFRKRFIADGFDAGKYRVRLMEMTKEFLEQSGKLTSKNETNARFVFAQTTLRNPCDDFFLQLIEEAYLPGTADQIYQRQKAIAIGRDLLVKTGGIKKTVKWMHGNKFLSICLFFTGLIAIITALSKIVYEVLK